MVEYDEVFALPSVRDWRKAKVFKVGYEDAESFLYFLDKYVTVMVGGTRAMAKYYKINCGKTLLDRLSPSDIAYSVLIYESAYDTWAEEIIKSKQCVTIQEKKAFQHTAVLKYHVKRGTRIALFQDGWTNEGRAYYKSLCKVFDTLKTSDKIWSLLQHHWKSYTPKYHIVGVEERHTREDNSHNDNCGDDLSDNDDNCIVSLPGENNSNGKINIEFGSEEDEYSYSNKRPNSNKRPRV